jgi:hypothetical protein
MSPVCISVNRKNSTCNFVFLKLYKILCVKFKFVYKQIKSLYLLDNEDFKGMREGYAGNCLNSEGISITY